MDSSTIGDRGEVVVQHKLCASGNLDIKIYGGKYPCWDGAVFVYNSSNHAKKNMIGRVPIQIKAHKTGASQEQMTHNAKVVDLENYLKEGGAVYIGVWLTSNNDGTLYYKTLQPLDIKLLLRSAGNNNTVTVNLNKLPEAPELMADVFFRFLQARNRAFPSIHIPATSIEELEELGYTVGGERVAIIDTLKSDEEGYDVFSLKGADIYSYVKVEECNGLLIPVEHHEGISNITVKESRPCSVTINGVTYYHEISVTFEEAKVIYRFGGITVTFEDNKTSCLYQPPSYLLEKARDMEALSALAQYGFVDIGDEHLSLSPEETERLNNWCKEQNDTLLYMKDCIKTLNALGCKCDLRLTDLSEEDDIKLRNLVNVTLYDIYYLIEPKYNCFTRTISIANLRIKVLLQRVEENKYSIDNYFNHEFGATPEAQTRVTPISAYATLSADEYVTLSNIDATKIAESLIRYTSDEQLEYNNETLLVILSAYDRCKEASLLQAAIDVGEWLHNTKPDDMTFFLNWMQTLYRNDALNKSEQKLIRERIAGCEFSDEQLVAAYILLDNHEMAEVYLMRLPSEQIKNFKKYPIYNLLVASKLRGSAHEL